MNDCTTCQQLPFCTWWETAHKRKLKIVSNCDRYIHDFTINLEDFKKYINTETDYKYKDITKIKKQLQNFLNKNTKNLNEKQINILKEIENKLNDFEKENKE